MIEKFKHGSEISSAKLNQIVEAVNKLLINYASITEVINKSDTAVATVNSIRESFEEELNRIPEMSSFFASIFSLYLLITMQIYKKFS